jgi:hypothetical protein
MVHHRFHVDACVYQALSPVINVLATRVTLAPLDHARLAWSLVAFADPVLWGPVMEYINFPRAQEADFVVGGRKYAVFPHDWRAEPFEAWWNRMGERMVTTLVPGEPIDDGPAQIAVLSKPEFEAAVRQALRRLHASREAGTQPASTVAALRRRSFTGASAGAAARSARRPQGCRPR